MGRRFNGSSDFLLMNIGSVLGTLDGGPRTYAYLATVYDQTDGAVIHTRIGSSAANNDQCWWIEHAGNDWSYGTRVAARRVGDAPIGDLCVFVVRKDNGGSAVPTGRIINITAGGTVTDTSPAPAALADNDTPGPTGELRIGKWGGASEFLNADLHALATWDRVLSDAETLDLDLTDGATWDDWLDLGPVGAWPFNQASATDAVPDDSGNGATSATITGTTIVADPVGFFGGGGGPTTYNQSVSGGLTPAGVLVRRGGKTLAGALTPAGALVRQAQKRPAGALTPAGALARQAQKTFAGGLTPAATLARQTAKTAAGALTPAGTVATLKAALRTFTGSLTPSGAVTRQVAKVLGGTLAPAGSLRRLTARTLAGTLAAAGTLAKQTAKRFVSALSPAGVVTAGLADPDAPVAAAGPPVVTATGGRREQTSSRTERIVTTSGRSGT